MCKGTIKNNNFKNTFHQNPFLRLSNHKKGFIFRYLDVLTFIVNLKQADRPTNKHQFIPVKSSLKGVFAKNERGYRYAAKNKRFWSLLILLLFVVL